MKVTVAKRKTNGKVRWCVDWLSPGQKRQRVYYDTQREADSRAELIRLQKADSRTWFALSPTEQLDLMSVWHEVASAGLTVRAVWERYRVAPDSRADGPVLSVVIEELLTAKRAAGRSEKYVSALKGALNRFASGISTVSISRVSVAELEAHLATKSVASRNTLRARLSTLFKFAIRRGYVVANPCVRLDTVNVAAPTPSVFTVEQAQACLNFLAARRPRALAWFVLATFCGLRPEEAEQTKLDAVNFVEGFVRVEAQTSKVRQRRIVYPKPEAMLLLRSAIDAGGELPLSHQARRRSTRAALELFGWSSWPKDITRHTAASYWLAAGGDTGKVADMLGTSERVLRKHYKAMVTGAEAEKFWRIAFPTK